MYIVFLSSNILDKLTFNWNNELRHNRQYFIRSLGDQIMYAMFDDESEGVSSFSESVEEHW